VKPARAAALAIALAGALAASGAAAQMNDRSATAQALFEEGLALMNAGKLTDACPKLAKSQELDPGMGTAFRLGECYEKVGRLASAWELFVGVAESARKTGAAQRAEVAQKRADALFPRLAKLIVNLAPGAAATEGISVTRDGVEMPRPLFGAGVPIDPGAHEIRAIAPRKKPFSTSISVPPDAKMAEVTIPALEDAPFSPAPVPPPPPSPGRGQRIAGVVLGVVGLGGVGVGTAFGLTASSTWNQALGNCVGRAENKCPPAAQQKGDDAQQQAAISTIAFIAGGALVATGVVVFLTAPRAKSEAARAPRLHPWFGAGTGGIVAEGSL
jgi:hypothetical protein